MTDVPRDYSSMADGSRPALLRSLSLFSWGAVFAGVAIALVVQILLTLLGVGLGLAAVLPGDTSAGEVATVSIVGAAWYVVAGILAAAAGGYVAARAKGSAVGSIGSMHGLVSWAATSLLVLYFMTSAVGGLVSGTFAGVSSMIGGAGKAVTEVAAPAIANSDPLRALENQVRTAGADPAALTNGAVAAMQALVTGDEAQKTQAREQAATALSRARSVSIEEARTQVSTLEKEYSEKVAEAKELAAKAAHAAAAAASTGSLLAFAALVLGAIGAWFGGQAGARHSISAVPVQSVPS